MGKNRNAKSQYLPLFTIFGLVAVVFIALGILYYRYEAQHIEDDKYEDISVIAKLKADSIQDWRRQRLADVKRVAMGPLVRREIARLLHDTVPPGDRTALQIQLNINRKDTVYADALFLDTKGNILLSDNPNPAPIDQKTMKAIEVVLKDHKEVLGDFFRDSRGVIYLDAVAPIPDNSGQPIAIVVLRSKAADFLYPLIQSWPTPSKTAETALARWDGDSVLFLNELRHKPNTALIQKFLITRENLPFVQAVSEKYGRFYGRDYRGVEVLAVGIPITQSSWFILAKVDKKEILTEVRYRAWVVGIIVSLILLIAAGLISIMYRNQKEVERKNAEEILKESEKKYRLLADNVNDVIFVLDMNLNYTYISPSVKIMRGYEPEEILKQSILETLMPSSSDLAMRTISEAMEMEKREHKGINISRKIQLEMRRKNETTVWTEVNLSFIKNENKQPVAILGITREITERKQAEERIRKTLGATVQAIALAVETRDPYTAGHQRRVADLARAISTEMNLPIDMIEGIRIAASIHDLGKISVPSEILSKPTKLTNIEFSIIKSHSQSGYDILKDIDFPWPVARMVLEHHERMNGSGYPNGLTGENILVESKILAVSDVVEAIASHRPYRPSLGIESALEEIEKNRETLYDNSVVDSCLRLFREKSYQLI
ncbi:MAG: PAS domain S-box protein [Deltaproteobacteria bacterium]|nr:PAS domain S-box protein [Deltaproteobacteria bacterium]